MARGRAQPQGGQTEAVSVLTDLPLEIDPDEVLRFQGYKRGIDVPGPDVLALFDEALALGRRLIAPRVAVRWAVVRHQRGDTLETDDVSLTIPDIARNWGPVRHLAAAVVTIGEALERRVAQLWDARELPLAAMLDSVGSGAVESLAEYVNDLLCQEGIARGWNVSNRISPGYGAWDVADQPRLFRLCPGAPIGVHLNEACFMTPEKSISLLVGAGPQARVDHYFSQCARCWMADCAYRRVPARRMVHRA
ncbi:MAG: vitamin B12 dependent-methionine synthase activation domain-containing protein [Candidatus Rokuibacteriota bacterium]